MPRTRVRRLPEKQVDDRVQLYHLLDEALVAHVALVIDGHPVALPTAFARDGDQLLVHGSVASGWMREAATGIAACVTVTLLDGLVVARSAFESSMRYRSAAIFGVLERVSEAGRGRALTVMTEKLIPGRRTEVRPSTPREERQTLVLSMPIDSWSLKVSSGWPEDPEEDRSGPAWAGVVPLGLVYGRPLEAPDLRPGIPVPQSVVALTTGPKPAVAGR